MSDNDKIIAQAWERTKAEGDPSFAECAPDHQARLRYKLACLQQTGLIEDDFDAAALALLNPLPVVAEAISSNEDSAGNEDASDEGEARHFRDGKGVTHVEFDPPAPKRRRK